MQKNLTSSLIAPCGMNCGICIGYLRNKNKCPGCRYLDKGNIPSRVRCRIKNCERLQHNHLELCGGCNKYPCSRLKQLDKRYRTKYGMSMIENLNYINDKGIRAFIKHEKERWTCAGCGSVICVHRKDCISCGEKRKGLEIT